jgi:oligopeptide transport system substrate-binding protein
MRTLHVVKLITIATLVLSACVASPTPATPTTAPGPSPQPATALPSSSPIATTAVPVTLAAPKSYPPRPTATLYATPDSTSGTYTNGDLGISLRYPDGWNLTSPDPGSDILTWIDSPTGDVFAALFANPIQSDQTLQTAAAQIRDGTLTGLKNMKIVSDQASTLDDGRDAWTTIATGARDDGTELKINLTTAINGARAYSLLILGAPTSYDDNTTDIGQLIGALSLTRPALYGLGRDQSLVLAGGESKNPREYDPATTHGSGDKLVFSGLVSFDPKLNLVPDLAGSWDAKDGTVYTFRLRPDARFHNGKPVTTQDVIYSWERAADPKTKSDTVLTYLGDIVGVKEMSEGKADHISGLKAIDDHTLQVTIDAPKPYFLLKLTYPTAFVVDRQNVESGPDWYRTPNGTGPYRLARWDSFKLMLYERNDDYYLDPPAIPYAIIQLFTGDSLRLYESGDVDMTGVGSSSLPRFEDPKEPLHTDLINGVSLCTGMILFDVKQPPFDDPKVRQAFSLAFNRSQYVDVVLHGDALPALGPLPPGLPGFNANLKGLQYDPARARQLLAESKYGSADKLPPIVYTDGGTGSDVGGSVAALAQMWQQNLGVTITVENVEPDKYSDLMHAGQHGQIFEGGWCADYPDPENFVDVLFHTDAQQNQGHYSNRQLDALVEQARVEQNTAKRLQLYQQAEQIIVDDAPAIFTTHSLSHVLVKPYIKGYVLTPIDIPLERYLSIEPSKMK